MAEKQIVIKLGADTSGVEKAMSKVQSSVGSATKNVANSFGGIGGAVKGVSGKISSFVGVAAGIAGVVGVTKLVSAGFDMIKSSVGSAFDRIDTMEQFGRVMETMLGSTAQANAVLETTNGIVKGTAYGLDVAAMSVQKFVTSNMGVDKATATVENWGNAVSFYGDGSNETFSSVTDALAKMSSKGKVDMEQMNRITEAGIPALQLYADATGQSVEEVATEMGKGNIKTEEFTNVMNDALANGSANFEGVAGASKEAGASWGATFDNMKAAVTRGMTSIIESIDEMLVSNGLPDMRQLVSDFGAKFEEVLSGLAEKIPAFVEKIIEIKEKITEMKEGFQETGDKIKELTDYFLPLIAGITAMAASFGVYALYLGIKSLAETIAIASMYAMSAAGTALASVMAILTSPITLVIVAIGLLVAIGVYLWKNWDTIGAKAGEIFGSLGAFFAGVWQTITEGVSSAWSAIGAWLATSFESIKTGGMNTFTQFKDFFVALWKSIATFISGIWSGISAVFNAVVNAIVTFVKSRFENLKSNISTVFSAVKTVISTVWNAIKTIFNTVVSAIVNVAKTGFNNLKNNISTIFSAIRNVASTVWNAIKNTVVNVVNGLKSSVSSTFSALKNTVVNVWNGIKSAIKTPMEAAKNAVKKAIDKIKGFMDFKWSLPSLKMPKFSLSGKLSLKDMTVPKLGISWHQNGGIVKGSNGGTVVGVGENGGSEAIVPLSNKSRMKPFASAVASMMPQKDTTNGGGGDTIITGNTFQVREEADIKKVAIELQKLEKRNRRGKGKE